MPEDNRGNVFGEGDFLRMQLTERCNEYYEACKDAE